ncbi:MAG TPA: dienelactone hydrolase family protein [Acidimicrobiales bacterium]|nr:dienelactone hydrolase family protein [Acidimicrobiales bacterium]
MIGDLTAQTVTITGDGGDEVQAYLAEPQDPGPHGGVVVIHHLPGFDDSTKEIARRFAADGYTAIVPNLYWREAPGLPAEQAFAAGLAAGGIPDDRLVGDVDGARHFLSAMGTSSRRIATIGFCSGGRQSLLAGCRLPLQAAVDCYGGFVTRMSPKEFPIEIHPVIGLVSNLSCPLLGLFGNDDENPSPADVDELEQALTEQDKIFEFHRYDGAGHAFFNVDRPSYRAEAAKDGWQRILDFFGRHLAS